MLSQSVGDWIKENKLKQEEAAEILGVSRPRISDVVNQKIGKFTVDTLIGMLVKAGKTVQIEVK
ncbi:Uncharacterised protein [Kingella negevensis]|uniref:HTH cro/C1-type domain-containing protein n=2 Tax=Kingella negevensis TaxID=1522312 RepID=A0A238HF24_9NEIS|nr:Uncharacterised protein [Kingella negevensis]